MVPTLLPGHAIPLALVEGPHTADIASSRWLLTRGWGFRHKTARRLAFTLRRPRARTHACYTRCVFDRRSPSEEQRRRQRYAKNELFGVANGPYLLRILLLLHVDHLPCRPRDGRSACTQRRMRRAINIITQGRARVVAVLHARQNLTEWRNSETNEGVAEECAEEA
eukprot:5354489-Pyramimonas_sp.AAC.1